MDSTLVLPLPDGPNNEVIGCVVSNAMSSLTPESYRCRHAKLSWVTLLGPPFDPFAHDQCQKGE